MTETTSKTRRPPTFDHLAKKKPLERRVTVAMDDEVVREYDEACAALERAELIARTKTEDETRRAELDGAVDAARERRDAARAAIDAETVTITFRSVGRKRYERLVDEHPPTDEQIEEYRKAVDDPEGQPAYDGEAFPIALISASALAPRMTREQVAVLYHGGWNCGGCGTLLPQTTEECPLDHDGPATGTKLADLDEDDLVPAWNQGEYFELFNAAMEVNTQRRVVELGKGRG